MAIMFRCHCGKVMQAREEHAGSRCKCVSCGGMLQIPAAQTMAANQAASAGEKPKSSEEVETLPYPPPPQAVPPHVPPAPAAPPGPYYPGQPPRPAHEGGWYAPAEHSPAPGQALRPAPNDPDTWFLSDPRIRRRRRRRKTTFLVIGLFLLLAGLAVGGWFLVSHLKNKNAPDTGEKKDPAPDFTPFVLVPRDGTGFASVRVGDAWNSKALEKVRKAGGADLDGFLKKEFGLGVGDIERVTLALAEKDWDIAGFNFIPEIWVIVHTRVPLDQDKLLGKLLPLKKEEKAKGKVYFVDPLLDLAVHFPSAKEAWIGPPKVMRELVEGTRKIAGTGPLTDTITLAAGGEQHLVVGFHVPEKLRTLLRMKGIRPDPPGMDAFLDLLSGSITLNLDEGGNLDYRMKFAKEESASRAAGAARELLAQARRELTRAPEADVKLSAAAEKFLREVKIESNGAELLVTAPGAGEALASFAAEGMSLYTQLKDTGTKTIASNNLRQILLALHSYHDVHKKLPPARINKGLSWRVAILPYIEQMHLYNRFHLDEPWDSPHNIKLLDEMPLIYQPVGGPLAKPGYTCYQVVTGDRLIFHSTLDNKSRLTGITDGTSNTFLVVESGNLVPWTAPEDVRYQPFAKEPRPVLGYQVPGHFLVGFGDATVRWFSTALSQEALDRFIDPRDGFPVLDEGFR